MPHGGINAVSALVYSKNAPLGRLKIPEIGTVVLSAVLSNMCK